MASLDAGEQELSNDVTFIKIGKRYWQLGEEVYSIGDEAVEKAKMVAAFGDAWRTARLEGVILGRGGLRKVSVQWTNLPDEPVYEYGYQHKMFRKGDEDQAEKRPEKRPKMGISLDPDRAKVQKQLGADEQIVYSDGVSCASSESEEENLDRPISDSEVQQNV